MSSKSFVKAKKNSYSVQKYKKNLVNSRKSRTFAPQFVKRVFDDIFYEEQSIY